MITKTAAPKGVKNKKLWDKIEKQVIKFKKYKGNQVFKVVQKAYQKAGGEYTHKSKAENATDAVIKLGKEIDAKLNKKAWHEISTKKSGEMSIGIGHTLGGGDKNFVELTTTMGHIFLTAHESLQLAKALTEHAERLMDEALMGETPNDTNDARSNPFGKKDHYGFERHIKVGDPVEFTREPVKHYAMGDGEFGIAIENERPDGSVMVELADGSHYLAKHIHAFAWGGWIPEELEDIQMKYQSNIDEDFNDARFRSVEETKKIQKEHPGKWIVYVNGDSNPDLEFKTEHEAIKAAKNEWEASLLPDVKVSVCWAADEDDPRFGELTFTPFYELGKFDQFGRWTTAWDKIK